MAITLKGVHLGHMGLDKSLLVEDQPSAPFQCPVLAYIIETPDGRILWETGVSVNNKEEWLPEWQEIVDLAGITPEVCLENRLKQLALGPEDFRWVVQGHLHTDHAGGLRTFRGIDVEVIVHEEEYNHVKSLPSDAQDFFNKADTACLEDLRTTTISGDTTELTRDVHLVFLPGHTPGQMGLLVRLETTGWVLLTSDALYHHQSYGPPAVGTPIVWDREKWERSVEKLRTLAMEREAFLFPGHDDITGIKQWKDGTEFRSLDFTPGYEYA
jgi:N-acyl homoserine lactone hydrolase